MIEYLHFIMGFVFLFGGLYGFLLAFKFYEPKFNNEEGEERMRNWHQKFGKMMKILSIILMLSGIYYISQDSFFVSTSEDIGSDWTEADELRLTKECLNGTNNPFDEKVTTYCKCVAQTITGTISKQEYIQITQLVEGERVQKLRELVNSCLESFSNE